MGHKRKRKKCMRSLGNMEKRKEKNGARGRREKLQKDSMHCSTQQCAIKSSFIHTVGSNYQCIYSIP